MTPKKFDNKLEVFFHFLSMIPSIIGGIGKLFTGQGLDFPLDKESN